MLSFFRRGIWAKFMLVILGIGLFAIVITGFGTGGIGGLDSLASGGTTLARVEGERITDEDATDQVQRQLKRLQQQQPGLDTASFLRGGALEEIVEQLVTNAARVVFGREQGLAATKAMVDAQILAIPTFQNLAGAFDENAFRNALQQEGITEAQLRREIAASLIERQLIAPVATPGFVPDSLAFQYASLLLERRIGTVGKVPAAAMGTGVEPTDAEIAAFYRGNQARYAIPERRALRYALFGTEQVAAAAKATDAEIAARYRQNAAAYAPRETRGFSQVVIQDEAGARAFAQRIAGGMSFAAAASQAGFGPADTALGELSREELTRRSSAAVAAAAYAAAQGATTAPVKSPFGWHIIRVDSVKTVPGRPLAAVRDELAAQIEKGKSVDALTEMINRIDRSIGDASLEEIARAEKLNIVSTPPVTAQGVAPGDPAWAAPPELAPLLQAVAGMTEDDDPLVEALVEDRLFALVQVAEVVPSAAPPLASIRDRVKADLIARRGLDRARAVAASLVAKINAGTSPAQAFAQADVPLAPPAPRSALRREIAQQDPRAQQSIPPEMAMLFSLPRGKARLLAAPDGSGWFVVHLDTVVPGDARSEPQLIAAIRAQFAQILAQEYAQQFTNALRVGMDIERNDKSIAALRKRLTGSQ